ncbi:hypothetical protein Tco_1146746 [Tanacetum coccineum]
MLCSDKLGVRRSFEIARVSRDGGRFDGEHCSVWKLDREELRVKIVCRERQINQGLRNRQSIIENLKRQFKYLEKTQHTKSLPRSTNTKLKHEFLYKPPSIRNDNDKRDVKIKPILTMPNPNQIHSSSSTVSPFLKDCIVHIPYTNVKTFTDDVLPNHVGNKELKSIDGVGNGVLTKKETKKENDNRGMPKEPNNEWKLNEKAIPYNKDFYHYLWHPAEIPYIISSKNPKS